MKKILVYDVAAEHSGALTILQEVYAYAKEHTEIEWNFVVSIVDFPKTANIKVSKYPDVKKSWLARYKFDKMTAPKLIKEYAPDIVLNLQNIAVKTKSKQVIYMQQSLPFSEYKFPIKQRGLWIYQNIIGRMIKRGLRKADEIIVQSNWVKDAIAKDKKIDKNIITVKHPTVDTTRLRENKGVDGNIYFYPANYAIYKNHPTIIKACQYMKELGFSDYRIILTLVGDENENIIECKRIADEERLNIDWVGHLTLDEVYEGYSKYNMLFASYIETFGLPLLEARLSSAPIIASDTLFAREICEGYDKAKFFPYDDYKALANIIMGKE